MLVSQTTMSKVATNFERRILFGLGRHFWNTLGVTGAIAIATGAILLADYHLTAKSYSNFCEFLVEEKSLPELFRRMQNCSVEKVNSEWVDPDGISEYFKEYQSMKGGLSDRQLRKVEDKVQNLIIAPLLVYWGFGAVATSSVLSAILSIERNTRKENERP